MDDRDLANQLADLVDRAEPVELDDVLVRPLAAAPSSQSAAGCWWPSQQLCWWPEWPAGRSPCSAVTTTRPR